MCRVVCRTIDEIEGPLWGTGTLTGRVADSEIDGHWNFQVNPGRANFMIDLAVHLSRR
jgi:hypothetical protein